MSTIKLCDLFERVDSGGTLVALDVNGNLISINQVSSGLACNCSCPGCGRRLVAKKGAVQAHHFAHYAEALQDACTSAGESALHRFAKDILAERREISLPSMILSDLGEYETVVTGGKFQFEQVTLEKKSGSIVPDVILEIHDRKLIVEFMVTHACDEHKILRIKTLNIAAIEVDLSKYRNETLDNLRDKILYEAPRVWLHNPKELQARERLGLKIKEKIKQTRNRIKEYKIIYEKIHQSWIQSPSTYISDVTNAGLNNMIGISVNGSGCFKVPPEEWQSAILISIIDNSPKHISTNEAIRILTKHDYINSVFKNIDRNVLDGLGHELGDFATPEKAVHLYKSALIKLGILERYAGESWVVTWEMARRIKEQKDLRERPGKRLKIIQSTVENIIRNLPNDEIELFDFNEWLRKKLPERTYSAFEALNFEEYHWRTFESDLSNVSTMIRFAPTDDLDLLGLPLRGEQARSAARKHQENEERESRTRKEREEEAAARLSTLQTLALEILGESAEAWLNSSMARLQGRSPVSATRDGDDGYGEAIRELNRWNRELDIKRQAEASKRLAVRRLHEAVQSRLDEALVDAWMRGKHPGLNGLSPIEFTVDDTTCNKCISLLDSTRRRRR